MTTFPRVWGVIFVVLVFIGGSVAASGLSLGDEKPSKPAAKARSKSAAKSKPAVKIEEVEEPAAESTSDADDDLSAFIVPARFLAKAKESDRQKFSQELRGLLLEGFKEKGTGLEAARKHLDAARRLVADDPLALYAYGVVLLAQKKSNEALEQFRSAAKQTKVPFLPALQGVAWILLSRNDLKQGVPAVLDLARRLEESGEVWPTAHDKERSAEWLGRTVGFLAGPAKTAERAAEIDKLTADVEKRLTAERKTAYERGRKGVAARHAELKALGARPAEEVIAESKAKREEDLTAAAAADGEVKKLEDELRELKKPHDKQLADLSREIRENGTKANKLAPDLEAMQAQVDDLSEPRLIPQVRTGPRLTPYTVMRAENKQEQKAREKELAAAQVKLDQLRLALQNAKQQIAEARKQRDEAQVEYKKATAEKRLALQTAKRKSADLAIRARDAEPGSLTPEGLKSRATAVETYVPLYPEVELGRMMAIMNPTR